MAMKQKILTVAIPCYNSEAYMEKCIHSLLTGGDSIEILIVDDGSAKDRTPQIADSYEKKYPGIIRAIHQENGGHGEAVNAGLRNASGLYYKVVDSDDWVGSKVFPKVVETLTRLEEAGTPVDMFLANFIYDKVGAIHKKTMRFAHVFPENEIFTWDQVGRMRATQYLLMHNIFYRTQMLRDCGIELPKHTFYVDNIFAFQPLPYVKKMYYMDVNLYHYYIGREDQSVNEKIMIKRIDQQIRVNKIMLDVMASQDFSDKSPRLKKYMQIYLDKIMTVTCMMLILDGSKEAMAKKKDIWAYAKNADPAMHRTLKWTPLGICMHLPGAFGRLVCLIGYRIGQLIVGFN